MATLSIPNTITDGIAADGDNLGANFSAIETHVNTNLVNIDGTVAMAGDLNMASTYKVINLAAPVSANDAATKTYVDTADALALPLTGGTMSGAIAMGTAKITGLGDPTAAQDAATKAYVDAATGSLGDLASLNTVSATEIDTNAVVAGKIKKSEYSDTIGVDLDIRTASAGAWVDTGLAVSVTAGAGSIMMITAPLLTYFEDGAGVAGDIVEYRCLANGVQVGRTVYVKPRQVSADGSNLDAYQNEWFVHNDFSIAALTAADVKIQAKWTSVGNNDQVKLIAANSGLYVNVVQAS